MLHYSTGVLKSRIIQIIFTRSLSLRMPSKKESHDDSKKASSDEPRERKYWLVKSEPETRMEKGVDVKFGIEDLKLEPDQTACWDGVRNYQARNFLRDEMKIGDKAFFYHSNCKPPGIAGLVDIVSDGYPDHTQFDRTDIHYDAKAERENPRWYMVDVKYVRIMDRFISLQELKKIHQEHKLNNGPLKNIALFTKARLSVKPVSKEEFEFILSLEKEKY